MKITYRIPTKEPFAFVEITGEADEAPAQIRANYESLIEAFRDADSGPGLPTPLFNKALDEYLETGSITDGADLYAQMDSSQQRVFQEIKKSIKRRA